MAPSLFDEHSGSIEPEIDNFQENDNHSFQPPIPIWPSPLNHPQDEEPLITQKGREWIEGSRVITLALLSSLMLIFVLILMPAILKFMVCVSRYLWSRI